jgi:hypothetical protein
MRDFSLLIENASKLIEDEAIDYLFVGIDECFNRSEIKTLVAEILNKGLARSARLYGGSSVCLLMAVFFMHTVVFQRIVSRRWYCLMMMLASLLSMNPMMIGKL